MSDRGDRRRRVLFSLAGIVGVGLSIGAATAAAAASEPPPPAPRFRREAVERDRPAVPPPPVRELPPELVLKASTGAEATRRPVREPPTGGTQAILQQAAIAADWAAAETARTRGWVGYYRLGVHEGLRSALADASIGTWDFREGVRLGLRDPEALRFGSDVGAQSAASDAERLVAEHIAELFRDLSRPPRPAPRPALPTYDPGTSWTAEPELREVFLEYPQPTHREWGRAFQGWSYDPWRLSQSASHSAFHDARWGDAVPALELWRREGPHAAAYRQLGTADRLAFDASFADAFRVSLVRQFERQLRRAFRAGLAEGWALGAGARAEWQFRSGYREGFDRAVGASALASFRANYPLAYERAYVRQFEEWSTHPRLEILSLMLKDGNDDGIFEPGEELLANYEVANYGGRGGTFTATLDGPMLAGPADVSVSVPARSLVRPSAPQRATIDPSAGRGARTRIDLRLSDAWRSADLVISRPLAFQGSVTESRFDASAGHVTVAAQLVNRSRRAVTGAVELELPSGIVTERAPGVQTIEGGQVRQVEFALTGIPPIDLLSGSLVVRAKAMAGGQLHDELTYRFPNRALDLRRGDLVAYLLQLARTEGAAASDVASARDLLLQRLRVDWDAAVRADGNPYKQDRRDRGSRTALGELVRARDDAKGSLRNRAVFDGLDDAIKRLAESLPGVHPLLRKHMKQLASRLN